MCRYGGTGRRKGLKIPRWQHRIGSTPITGTKNKPDFAVGIFDLQAGAPMAITGGIGEALIATATGLCVAIMALCVHSYFAHRMEGIITNMEQCFSALLEHKTRGELQ